MTRALSVLLVALVALVGCGPSAPPPQPPRPEPRPTAPVEAVPTTPLALDRDLPRLAARSVQLYQDVVRAFATVGVDCGAAATRIGELQKTYAEVVAANGKVLHDGRARELRVALEPHAETLDTAAKTIVQSKTMSACASDRPFAEAFDALVAAPP